MGEILLVTRPKFDDATEYLSYYASLILKEASKNNISCKDFSGKEVNEKNVTKFVEKINPKLIFVNGHGDPNSFEENEGEIIFSVEKNVHLLKDKLLYARACNAGLIFGKEMVRNNEGCFIGYNTPFTFWIDGKYSAIPAKDNLASLFLLPSNEIVNSLIKGNNAKESNEKSKKMMVENMKKILQMEEKDEPGATGWLGALWNNYVGQVVYGNEEMCF